jgi:hypothetical protein
MITRNTLLRVMFCASLSLFVFAIFSPWAGLSRSSIVPFRYSGEELHWSFQAVFYPYKDGYENKGFSLDFWVGPHDRLVLWDFWFSRSMSYHGLAFGWIHLFILQLLTVLSGIAVLVWRWKETKYLLIPLSSSIFSVIIGLELVITYELVWTGYTHPYWGLPVAIFSTFSLSGTYIIRYLVSRAKCLNIKPRVTSEACHR